MVTKTLGMPKASLTNWVRADARGELGVTADGKVAPQLTPEQAEIARQRAEVVRLRMERDIARRDYRGAAPSH